jgi:hypothetical protein
MRQRHVTASLVVCFASHPPFTRVPPISRSQR